MSSATSDAPPVESAPVENPLGGGGVSDKVLADRQKLLEAQRTGKRWWAYVQLSGPGWLQSAITLGGGSLASALFLGVLGGTSLLWLQLIAIVLGVVMLSAISYVTLSTGRRPFEAINTEINPALGWGWLIATALANMIWCMPQFSLAYDAIDNNLSPLATGSQLGDSASMKWTVTAVLLVAAAGVVMLNVRQGKTAKLFDIVLKALIGMIVLCFFGVVILLAAQGQLDFARIFSGFIPTLSSWSTPGGALSPLLESLSPDSRDYWASRLVSEQRSVMIAAAATAVGINMTFLLPYSMLSRGWDRPFRGLARFDLSTGMAIPYILVTSCVVIAAATSFHATVDDRLLSDDPAVVAESPLYGGVMAEVAKKEGIDSTDESAALDAVMRLGSDERTVVSALVKRNAFQLSETLVPLLGESKSNLVFGLGVFGMGFSTIIILMLINGYVFREMMGDPDGTKPFVIGCLVAGLSGALWIVLWDAGGGAKFWLPIIASTFGMMLLPIAYITFFLMMNSVNILGDDKPTGMSMVIWNVLMLAAVIGAIVAAGAAIWGQMQKSPLAGNLIIGGMVIYGALIVLGFVMKRRRFA